MQAQFLLGNLAAMLGDQTDDRGLTRGAASMEMQVVPAIAKAVENLFRELVFGVFGFGLIFGLFSQGTRQPARAGGFFCCQKGHSFRSSSLSLRYTDNDGTARYMVVKVPKDIFEKNIRHPRNALHACAQGRVLVRRRRGAGSL